MIFKDRVKEIIDTVGTGDYTLGITTVGGFNTFGSVLANGDQVPYCVSRVHEFEVGVGIWNSGASTLTRNIIIASSNGGSLVDWTAGSKEIFITAIADSYPSIGSSNPTRIENPKFTGKEFINTTTGEIFICTDNTTDLNVWSGQLGTDIILSYIPTTNIIDSFSSPSTQPTGLAFSEGSLISCDTDPNMIYVHTGVSSTIFNSFASPSSKPYGLTFDGTNLISCDYDSDTIYIHDGISSTILSSFASPGSVPYGLAFDGTNLISCDYSTSTIYIHDGISSTILDSFGAPGNFPTSLTFDGANLISCDKDSDLIYVHEGISSTILTSIASPSTYPVGLAHNGTNLISCDRDSATIYIHETGVL